MANGIPLDGTAVDTAAGITPAGAVVLRQTARVLHPLVRLLLEHGVTYPQLADALKSIFIAACGSVPEIGRMTDSELAVRTGIHRKDVKRLRRELETRQARRLHRVHEMRDIHETPEAEGADDGRRSLTSAVFTRWLSDPLWCDSNGLPMTLPRNADSERSFDALVKSVSKDMHPRTVLNELSRLNLVRVEHDSVQLKVDAFVPDTDFAQMLEYMGANLHDHAAAAVQNILGTGPRLLEQSIFSEAIHAAAVQQVAGLARQEWNQLLKHMVPEVARHEPEQPPQDAVPGRYARVRLGMYFYAEDGQAPASNADNRSTK